MKPILIATVVAAASLVPGLADSVNVDFSRDTAAQNPGSNPAPVLYSSTGPAPDAGTVWNDLRVPLAATGDQGADSVDHPVQFNNLTSSTGAATPIDVSLVSGFYRSFNGAAASSTSLASLQGDRVFSRSGQTATLQIQGLDPSKAYDLYLITGSFGTNFTVGGNTLLATATDDANQTWTSGADYVRFSSISPTAGGVIFVAIQDGVAPIDGFGVIAGLQIVETTVPPLRFLYADSVTSTGGQFDNLASYDPANLMNNGFTAPTHVIDTTATYLASGNNYASLSPTPNGGVFDLTFDFPGPTEIDGLHVWNYVYRAANGSGSASAGVKAYELTFYDGPGATGAMVGSVFSGSLGSATFNAVIQAQSVYFPAPYTGVRSVVMRVLSNYGATFTGMNELAFNGASGSPPIPAIDSFTGSVPLVQKPAMATLSWAVSGAVTSLEITPGIGNVLSLTTGGSGSVPVSPIGKQTYTLTLNGTEQQTLEVIGLPVKEKLHLYLLIGQSNMDGQGRDRDPLLDAPDPRVLQFGGRDGMESVWVSAEHPLTSLASTGNTIGMGLEFARQVLADRADPEIVIGLINHAKGTTAIQWWAPGVENNKQNNPLTGDPYFLYDEAIQRVQAASAFGVIKGVLWHQGEYNSNNNSDPAPEPELYGSRLQGLVDNLRTDLAAPWLPFVCGKMVPRDWQDGGSTDDYTGLPFRATVEAAMEALSGQRTNSFCVDNAGLRGMVGEQIHFDAASQRELGRRYAAAMDGFYSDPFLLRMGAYYTPTELANPQIANPAGDNDGDGLANSFEIAMGNDPAVRDERPYSVTLANDGTVEFSHRRRTDTEAPPLRVEVSADLETWRSNEEPGPPVTEVVSETNGPGTGVTTQVVRATAEMGADPPHLFFRLRE